LSKKIDEKNGDTDFLVSAEEEGPSPDTVLFSLVAISLNFFSSDV
jgi:hypothetical protein